MVRCPRCGGNILGDMHWQSCLLCGFVYHDSGHLFAEGLLECLYRSRPVKVKPVKLEPVDWGKVHTRLVAERPQQPVYYNPRNLECEYWQVIRQKYEV